MPPGTILPGLGTPEWAITRIPPPHPPKNERNCPPNPPTPAGISAKEVPPGAGAARLFSFSFDLAPPPPPPRLNVPLSREEFVTAPGRGYQSASEGTNLPPSLGGGPGEGRRRAPSPGRAGVDVATH